MKRLHIIVITIFFNKMSVTGGVCYFLACGLQSLQKAQSFGNSVETDSRLSLWLSKLTLKNWTTTFLPQIISVYYLLHCSGKYFYDYSTKQNQTKKPHKPSHYIHVLLYTQNIQKIGYGRALLYIAPTFGCVFWVCEQRHRGYSSHLLNRKSCPWCWLFSGKDEKHLS